MEGLNIVVNQSQGVITTNFEEVEKALKLQMSAYQNFVVSEDEIPIAKGDLAFLRKLKKSIDERKKEVKSAYLEPYTEFEDACKKLMAIIDEPISTIDEQLQLFEADRKEAKRKRIIGLYEEFVGEYLEYLPFDAHFNEKWLNKSYTDSDIQYDISEMLVKIKSDLGIIKSLNSEIEEELLKTYKESGNALTTVIQRNQQYISDKARIEEAKKEIPVEPINEEPVKEPENKGAMQTLDDFVKATKMVKFIVNEEDAEQVRELLSFSQINYREE